MDILINAQIHLVTKVLERKSSRTGIRKVVHDNYEQLKL